MKSSSDHFKKHPFEHTAIRTRPALVQQIFPRANSAQPLGWRLFPRRVDRDELGRAKPAVPWRTDGGERRVAALVARSPLMPANTHTYTKHRLCEHTHTHTKHADAEHTSRGCSCRTPGDQLAAPLMQPCLRGREVASVLARPTTLRHRRRPRPGPRDKIGGVYPF